jgi:hypothetical protein
MTKKRIGLGIMALMAVMVVLVGCEKERTFQLDDFEDYIELSNVPFKDTDYNNTWLLHDSKDYKTVIKELDKIFKRDGIVYSSAAFKYVSFSFAIDSRPGASQAKLGIFKVDEDPMNRIIILEVGDAIKKGREHRTWPTSDKYFDRGEYTFKVRLSQEEYLRKLDKID